MDKNVKVVAMVGLLVLVPIAALIMVGIIQEGREGELEGVEEIEVNYLGVYEYGRRSKYVIYDFVDKKGYYGIEITNWEYNNLGTYLMKGQHNVGVKKESGHVYKSDMLKVNGEWRAVKSMGGIDVGKLKKVGG